MRTFHELGSSRQPHTNPRPLKKSHPGDCLSLRHPASLASRDRPSDCCPTRSLIAFRRQACFPFEADMLVTRRRTWRSRCSCADLPPHEIGSGGIWIECSLGLGSSFLSASMIPSMSECFSVKIDSPSPSCARIAQHTQQHARSPESRKVT